MQEQKAYNYKNKYEFKEGNNFEKNENGFDVAIYDVNELNEFMKDNK